MSKFLGRVKRVERAASEQEPERPRLILVQDRKDKRAYRSWEGGKRHVCGRGHLPMLEKRYSLVVINREVVKELIQRRNAERGAKERMGIGRY